MILRKYGAVQVVSMVQRLADDPYGVKLEMGKLPPSQEESRNTKKGQKPVAKPFGDPMQVGVLAYSFVAIKNSRWQAAAVVIVVRCH